MAKPHDDLGVSPGAVPARTTKSAKPASRIRKVCVGVALAVLACHAGAQPAPLTSADQEQRRAQERERLLREQQERTPDVRLPPTPAAEPSRLRMDESPCFVIRELDLKAAGGGNSDVADEWRWVLDTASGPGRKDSPLHRCLGAEGVNLVLKRVQDAVIARGYVTTRILAERKTSKAAC